MSTSTWETVDNQSDEFTPFASQPTDLEKKSLKRITRFYSQPDPAESDPFFYSQDIEGYLNYQAAHLKPKVQDVSTNTEKPSVQGDQKTKKKPLKRKACKNKQLQSHIIKKIKDGKRLIKISITNIEGNSDEEVLVQYVTQENTDQLLKTTEELVEQIVERLNNDIKST